MRNLSTKPWALAVVSLGMLLLERTSVHPAAPQTHWAYVRPVPPEIPAVRPLAGASALAPPDAFILARLEKEGLAFSPEAERHTLLRRLSFDLTGLPPAPELADLFLRPQPALTYEELVERLLASPAFGERMAVFWLDLVRYADTVGFHGDSEYSVWPYRDYVIRAFNDNLPFDRFTREQLGGDLLPQATDEQKVASGYNRLNRISAESGVQDREYRAKYAADRVRTTASVWMGTTLGCAECHDHKADPFSAKDFYRFAAFFADLEEQGYYNHGFERGDWGPRLALASAEQKATLQRLDHSIREAAAALEAVPDERLARGRERWAKGILDLAKDGRMGWSQVRPNQCTSSGGSTLTVEEDSSVLVTGKVPAQDEYVVVLPATPSRITGLLLDVQQSETLAGNDIARAGSTFFLSELEVWFAPGNRGNSRDASPTRVELASALAEFSAEGHPILAAIDGDPNTSWSVGSGQPKRRRATFVFAQPVTGHAGASLTVRFRHEPQRPGQHLGHFSLSLSSVERPNLDHAGLPGDVLTVLQMPLSERTPRHQRLLSKYYLSVAPELDELRQRFNRLTVEREILWGRVPTTLVSQATTPREIRVLRRGDWMDDTGAVVQPGLPNCFGSGPEPEDGRRMTRLDLANWLVAPDQPLTARVFVNRLWKIFFGTGLCRTLDDFGQQGDKPVHGALLDWLACEFMQPTVTNGGPAHAWDIKHIVRLLVSSRAYRQTSMAPVGLEQRDPFNRWLAHQTRFRLEAEMLRDNALEVAGLLVRRIGGPSVRPYQPEGYYAALHFPRREYVASQGPDLYRRSVYTHWQRTFLHPALLAFDAPGREECTVERLPSNTPLQALVLLNEPGFVEAARVFAEHILKADVGTFEQRMQWAYRRALTREPRPEEQQALAQLYQTQLTRFGADPTAARQSLALGASPVPPDLPPAELAAWTSLARALLNLHETITRN